MSAERKGRADGSGVSSAARVREFPTIKALQTYVMVHGGADRHDHLIALGRIEKALDVAYELLASDGYFCDPDYPEAKVVSEVVLGG